MTIGKNCEIVYLMILILGFVFLGNSVSGFDYVLCQHNGSSHDCVVAEPTYPTKPIKGDSIVDPEFDTEIIRVTDTVDEVDNYISGQDGITLRYSTFNHENSDATYVLFEDHTNSKTWNLYDAQTYEKIERLTDLPDVVGDGGPRWDATDPNVFYYTKYTVMYEYDLSQPSGSRISVVHDFSDEYPSVFQCDWLDEGGPSDDRRYWAFHCRLTNPTYAPIAIGVYDKETDTIINDITTFPYEIDWVAMSPSGDYFLVRWAYSNGRIWAYPRDDFSTYTEVCQTAGHSDRAVDSEDKDVIIYNSNTGTGQDGWYHMAYMDGTNIPLVAIQEQFGCSLGEHFSGNNAEKPGWAFISTYCGPDASYTGWPDGRIFAVQLKENPKVWNIAHHRSVLSSYRDAPFASVNSLGTKVYFGSNWGTGLESDMDVYVIKLPENWWNEIDDITIQPECDDSIDNDGDGYIDYPDDGGCGSLTDDDETDCGDDVCEGTEDCSDCTEDCLETWEQCCNGVAYDLTVQVCCSGAVYTGFCCDDSDCTLPETCNVNHICSGPVQIPGICNGLELLLHFDEDSSTVTDDSGNGNDGAVNGATYTLSGKFSGAFEYDGVDDYIQFSDSDSLDGYASMSFSFWLKLNEISELNFLISKYDANNGYRSYSIATDDSPTPDILFTVSSDGIDYETKEAATDLTTDRWYHIVVVFDAGGLDVYLDGTPVPDNGDFATGNPIYQGLSDLFIGSRSGSLYFFNGAIDEVAIWNRALSSQEVLDLTSGSPITCEESSCTSGADKDDSSSVSMEELIIFIDAWKNGGVTINQIIIAIGEWKSGC